MSLDNYLEKVDRGENILVQDMYQNGDYQEIVELLEYGNVNTPNIEVDREDANEIMDKGTLYEAKETLESVVSTTLEEPYDNGFEKGERAAQAIGRDDRLADKAQKKESKVRATEAGIAAGSLGALAGANSGSVHITGASALLGVVSGIFNSKYQGMRDAEMEKAAEGLEQTYGGHQIDIS